MTFTEAAAEVLRLQGKPLHFKDITQIAIAKNLLSHVGKTPDVTMGARLSLQIKKEPEGAIVRVKPGVFGLREWGDGRRKKKSAEPKVAPEETKSVDDAEVDESDLVETMSDDEADDAEDAGDDVEDADDANADGIAALATEVDAAEAEASRARDLRRAPSAVASVAVDDDDAPILDEDEKMRGHLAASATELFEEEEDDDQPLLGGAPEAAASQGANAEGGRRRRRRRRRGKGRDDAGPGQGASATPTFAASVPRVNVSMGDDEDEETIGVTIGDEQPTRRAIVLERVPSAPQGGGPHGRNRPQEFRPPSFARGGREPQAPREASSFDLSNAPVLEGAGEPVDELVGRDLADFALNVLAGADRNQGPIPVRAIADAASRRGRLAGDPVLATSAISAAIRADNIRRASRGERPRFRISPGARVTPTDWSLGADLLRLEQDALSAVERYRDAARRTLASKLQRDMSGPALVELLLLALERMGFRDVRPVRRAGLPGGENHFSGIQVGAAEHTHTAIVLRRDGREIGRERVIDLRGSLHHYGPATAGWLITTGQVLSGAREEAGAIGTVPVALFDSIGFAKLLEDHDIGVVKTTISVPVPDVELLESLRNGG
ncbi:MAG: HTH domain-containing protein [Polyangiales bacterium]